MVTGRQAFTGETTAVVFDGILNRTPRAPSEINSDVTPELERVIAKAIAKDRDERYQRTGDLVSDLRSLKRAGDLGGTATTMAVPATGHAWPSSATHTAGSSDAGVYWSATTLRNGDSSSLTASACLSVPSNIASPVELAKSAMRMRSLAASAWLRPRGQDVRDRLAAGRSRDG
jgi:hypothetical protein